MPKAPLKYVSERPRQQLPAEIVQDLMQSIRGAFYGDMAERWFAQQADIKRMFITWPAGWLNGKGVTLAPERYKGLLLEIIRDVKLNVRGEVHYWPRYLAHCVQMHFKCHGDEIYEEGKAFRNQVDRTLTGCQKAVAASQGHDPIKALALAHGALTTAHKRNKKAVGKTNQLDLI